MRTSRNRYSSYRIIFLFIKFIFFCEMIKEIYSASAAGNKESSGSPDGLAIPDFFADTENGMFFNPIVASATSKLIISIDGNLKNKISASEEEKASALCDEAIYEVLKENDWIARDQFIDDIQTKSLQIILAAPEASYDISSIGSYSIKHRQIVISYKPALTKGEYKMAILNELMSHLVVMSNKRCDIVTKEYKLMALPFLKKDGTVDTALMKKFEDAINTGLKRLEQVKKIWEKRTEKLSISENNVLIQFLAAAKYYTPKTYYTGLNEFGGRNEFNKMVDEYFYKDGDYLEPGPNMHGTPFFRGKIVGDYFIAQHTHNLQSAAGRLRGFLIDFENARLSLESKEGPYANLAAHHKISEFASFITELPKPLLNLFFPEFFSNIKAYVGRCRPDVATGIQKAKASRDTFFKPPMEAVKPSSHKRISPR